MPAYRLYSLDRYSGHFTGVEELHAADDVGAICMVQEMESQVPLELWLGARKVRRFEGKPEMAGYAVAPRPPRSRRLPR